MVKTTALLSVSLLALSACASADAVASPLTSADVAPEHQAERKVERTITVIKSSRDEAATDERACTCDAEVEVVSDGETRRVVVVRRQPHHAPDAPDAPDEPHPPRADAPEGEVQTYAYVWHGDDDLEFDHSQTAHGHGVHQRKIVIDAARISQEVTDALAALEGVLPLEELAPLMELEGLEELAELEALTQLQALDGLDALVDAEVARALAQLEAPGELVGELAGGPAKRRTHVTVRRFSDDAAEDWVNINGERIEVAPGETREIELDEGRRVRVTRSADGTLNVVTEDR